MINPYQKIVKQKADVGYQLMNREQVVQTFDHALTTEETIKLWETWGLMFSQSIRQERLQPILAERPKEWSVKVYPETPADCIKVEQSADGSVKWYEMPELHGGRITAIEYD